MMLTSHSHFKLSTHLIYSVFLILLILVIPDSLRAQTGTDTVWVEDALPAGATPTGTWNWIGSNPTPFSGASAHQLVVTGSNQHFFKGATATLTVGSGDFLFVYVYLDPSNSPTEVMLQWNDGAWGKAAYWGADQIATTPPRVYMGPLPSAGGWVRLEVPASQVALEGKTLNGMAFKQYNGRVTWDRAGKSTPPPNNPPTVTITSPADQSILTVPANITITANASDVGGAISKVEYSQGTNKLGEDTTAPYSWSWDGVAAGSYSLTARATDNAGATTTSGAVNITVKTLLSGKVTNAVTMAGIPGATVKVSQGSALSSTVTTNSTGDFTVTGLSAGTYNAEASAADYTPQTQNGVIVTETTAVTANFSLQPTAWSDIVWVEDAIPAGAIPTGTWAWVGNNPAPYSGTSSHQSVATGVHQHYFKGATTTLAVGTGDYLFAYVYLDPSNSPTEVMLQWNDGAWSKAAYWGADQIATTPPRVYMGPLPSAGGWVRLEVPASQVALEGKTLNGMAFKQYNGRVTWDRAGKSTPPPGYLADVAAITYKYDELGRLIALINPSGDTASYHYDAVGNLLSISRQASSQVSIINFTPGGGPWGTLVTIAGTGFSPIAGQNTVTFNGTTATVTSASPTQLTMSVPVNATTGPVTVTNLNGSATSSIPFTVNQGAGAPTITGISPTIGERGTTVTLTGTNFETSPVTNNRLRFNVSGSEITAATSTSILTSAPPFTGAGRISVTTPNGQAVSSGDFFIPPALRTTADVEVTGRMTYGETKTVTINSEGKLAMIAFDGTAGQRVMLNLPSVVVTAGNHMRVSMTNPDGTYLATPKVIYVSQGSAFFDPLLLPATGTYTILVGSLDSGSNASGAGTVTMALYDVPPDVNGSITPGGQAAQITITSPGQNGRLTFSGTAGRNVSLNIPVTTVPNGTVSIFLPDGSLLVGGSTVFSSSYGGFIEPKTLPVTGTYTILADPSRIDTGNISLNLYDVVDIASPITLGVTKNVVITSSGQTARLTFSATTGQQVSVNMTGMTATELSLWGANGQMVLKTSYTSAGATIDAVTLPATGTYTIWVNPLGAGTGSVNVTAYNAPDVVVQIAPGETKNITINTPGQNARVTFNGSAGQIIGVNSTGVTVSTNTFISVKRPDGEALTGHMIAGNSMNNVSLPESGTYTIFVDPQEAGTGSVSISLINQ
jgi:YD repeat-containing protein